MTYSFHTRFKPSQSRYFIMWTDFTVLKGKKHKYPTGCVLAHWQAVVFLHTDRQFTAAYKLCQSAANCACLYARRKAIRLILFPCPFQRRTDKRLIMVEQFFMSLQTLITRIIIIMPGDGSRQLRGRVTQLDHILTPQMFRSAGW